MTVAILLAGALGCGGGHAVAASAPAPATSSSLEEMLRKDVATDSAFPWSAARRLGWGDFQGAPPSGGSEAARTAYTLYSAWRCRGAAFEFRVVNAFRPRRAWVKAAVLRDAAQSRSVLAHEQTHFDLAEAHARDMQRRFARLEAPCRMTDGDLTALARRLLDAEKAEQRRYDDETNHGLLAEPQAAWSRDVAQRLAASR